MNPQADFRVNVDTVINQYGLNGLTIQEIRQKLANCDYYSSQKTEELRKTRRII